MDVTVLIGFVGAFGVCAALGFIFSSFGARKQTFEKVIAGQQRNNERNKTRNVKEYENKYDKTHSEDNCDKVPVEEDEKDKETGVKKDTTKSKNKENVEDIFEEDSILLESFDNVPSINNKSKDQTGMQEEMNLISTIANDFEEKQINDVFLNKTSSVSNTWMEQGKLSDTAKLQKYILELETALEGKVSKIKSLKDKVKELRRERNDEISAKDALSRIIEEINESRTQETNNMSDKLRQLQSDAKQQSTAIQTKLDEQIEQNHQLVLNQTNYLATIENLNQHLEKANDAASNASKSASVAHDQDILLELEELRRIRNMYEISLKENATKNKSSQEQVEEWTEEALESNCDSVEVSVLQEQLEQVTDSQNQLKIEVLRLQSENSRLSVLEEEYTRVKIENEEQEKTRKNLEEKIGAVQKELTEKSDQCEYLMSIQDEGVKIIEELNSQIEIFEMQINGCEDENAALGTENSGANEYFISSEQNDMKSNNGKLQNLDAIVHEEKTDLLKRLFPSQDLTASGDELEVAVKKQIDSLVEKASSGEQEKMEIQVSQYKSALAQTESLLESLKSTAELEESQWRTKLELANREINELKIQISTLQQQMSDLEQSAILTRKAEEVTEDYVLFVKNQKRISETLQVKLADLQSQLSIVIDEKNNLKKEVVHLSQKLNIEHAEHDDPTMKQEEIISKNKELIQILAMGQETLENEAFPVKSMQGILKNSQNNCENDSIEDLEILTQTEMNAHKEKGRSGTRMETSKFSDC